MVSIDSQRFGNEEKSDNKLLPELFQTVKGLKKLLENLYKEYIKILTENNQVLANNPRFFIYLIFIEVYIKFWFISRKK
jgi:hypothetical protein